MRIEVLPVVIIDWLRCFILNLWLLDRLHLLLRRSSGVEHLKLVVRHVLLSIRDQIGAAGAVGAHGLRKHVVELVRG